MYLHDKPKQRRSYPGWQTVLAVIANMLFILLIVVLVAYIILMSIGLINVEGMEYIYVVTPDEKVVMKSSTNTGIIVGAHHLIWTDLDGVYTHYRVSRQNTVFILSEPHERYEKGKRKWILKTAEP